MQDRSSLTRRNLLATHGRTIHWVNNGLSPMSELGPLTLQERAQKRTFLHFVFGPFSDELRRSKIAPERCRRVKTRMLGDSPALF
jgi:hypothetical protein